MGLYKLREWVGTVTGKGDRWGRDSVGRSAPAFMVAGTTVLPPRTCTARGQLHLRHQLLFVLRGRPSVAVCFEACAGRRVRRLCLPAVLFCRLCVLPAATLPAMPTALHRVLAPVQHFACPRSSSCIKFALPHFSSFALFACHLFMSMCARIAV